MAEDTFDHVACVRYLLESIQLDGVRIEITADLAERVHDMACRSGACTYPFASPTRAMLECRRERFVIAFEGCVRDPLDTALANARVCYGRLCEVCAHLFARKDFKTCEACTVDLDQCLSYELRRKIDTERRELLETQPEVQLGVYLIDENGSRLTCVLQLYSFEFT